MCHLVAARDLVKLYETETKRINEVIYRNKENIPKRFCFRITEEDGSRKGHTVFTEQGVVMLAAVLKTHIAIKVSILLCKEKNKLSEEYSLKNINSPIAISEYKYLEELLEYLNRELKSNFNNEDT